MQLFVDMDGVLADFDRHYQTVFGVRSDKLLWEAKGGVWITHHSAAETIAALGALGL